MIYVTANFAEHEYLMLYAKSQGHGTLNSGDFMFFLLNMSMVAILVT